ncbi:MAG: hypothetical protein GVY32_11595 [Gammaproteobacteria bacterium]|jgi:hypothetical protein|nr:hypothetical protein [Gammaproteobacteria bacterium]
MGDNILAVEEERDVELANHGDARGFDNLLADEVVVDWLMQLEREQNLRAAAG